MEGMDPIVKERKTLVLGTMQPFAKLSLSVAS
jgi:hypothetical protein